MAAGPQVGAAHVTITLTLQQFQAQLRAAQQATQRAAQGMANNFNQVNVAGNRMNTNMRRWGGGIQALSRQFLVLRAAMAGVVAVIGIRAIAQAADAWANLTAKLNQVTTSAGQTVAIQEQLFRIAQRTGTELELVGDLYFKLSNASSELGMSQQQVMQFTDSLNKMFVTSGVSAVNSAQAIHQLTQAFTYQRLQGDELRTMHEAFPALIRTVAAAQGQSAQELMATAKKEGIAIQEVIEAVLKIRAEIDRQFAMMPVTIERAMQQVSNAFTKAVGITGTASGSFEGVTDALQDLSDTINSPEFRSGMALMLQFLATAATRGAGLVQFLASVSKEAEGLGERFTAAAQELSVPPERIKALKELGVILSTLWTGDAKPAIEILKKGLEDNREAFADLGITIGDTTAAAVQLNAAWDDLRTFGLSPELIAQLRAAGVSMTFLGEVIDEDQRKLDRLLGEVGGGARKPSAEATDLPPGIDPKAMDAANDAAKKHLDTIKDLDEAIASMQRRRAAEAQGEEAVAALERLEAAASAAGVAVEDLAQQPADIQGRVQTHQDEAAALDALIERQKVLKQAEEERAAAAKEQIDAIVEANRRAIEEQEQAAASEQQRIDQGSALPDRIDAANIAASGLASTLTDLENLSLESLAQSFADIGQQIAQAVVQALIFRAIMGATGTPASTPLPGMGPGAGAGGGAGLGTWTVGEHGLVFGRGGHLKRMARGGFITKRPMIMPMATGGALIGEAGPEAVMPLKRMASGNLGVASDGGGGGGPQQINNIYANNIEPGTVSTLYNLANRAAPGAVVNARSRGLVRERKKPPF